MNPAVWQASPTAVQTDDWWLFTTALLYWWMTFVIEQEQRLCLDEWRAAITAYETCWSSIWAADQWVCAGRWPVLCDLLPCEAIATVRMLHRGSLTVLIDDSGNAVCWRVIFIDFTECYCIHLHHEICYGWRCAIYGFIFFPWILYMGHSTELVQSQSWKHLEKNVLCMQIV